MLQARNYIPALKLGAKIIPGDLANIYGWGNTYFVSSVTGSDANSGTDTSTAFATLAKAVAACTASNDDTIIILPNHAETISTATALNINKAGVNIYGMGSGGERPKISLGTITGATITVSANNVHIDNVIFVAALANIAVCFTITTAKDLQITNCEFRDTTSILNFLVLFATDTTSNHADGLVINNCKFLLLATSGVVNLLSALGTNDRITITNNLYISPTTNASAVIPIATGKILTNFLLQNDLFQLANASGTATGYLITTDGSTNTGFIDNNRDFSLPSTPLSVTASSGFAYGLNYHADVADKAGYLVPAADV